MINDQDPMAVTLGDPVNEVEALPPTLHTLIHGDVEPPPPLIPVHPDFLKAWSGMLAAGVDAETYRVLTTRYDPAVHCPPLAPPRVDPILKGRMAKVKTVDRLDGSLAKSQALLANIQMVTASLLNTVRAADFPNNRDLLYTQLWELSQLTCAS